MALLSFFRSWIVVQVHERERKKEDEIGSEIKRSIAHTCHMILHSSISPALRLTLLFCSMIMFPSFLLFVPGQSQHPRQERSFRNSSTSFKLSDFPSPPSSLYTFAPQENRRIRKRRATVVHLLQSLYSFKGREGGGKTRLIHLTTTTSRKERKKSSWNKKKRKKGAASDIRHPLPHSLVSQSGSDPASSSISWPPKIPSSCSQSEVKDGWMDE